MSSSPTPDIIPDADAVRLTTVLRDDLNALDAGRPISPCALTAPRRRSARNSALASAVAVHLFPDDADEPLHALIQYERAIVDLRAAYTTQERLEREKAMLDNRLNTWAGRIEAQGPWDEINDPLSLEGPEAIPMPVKISSAESLAPFFGYLAQGGDFEGRGDMMVQLEPFYEEPYIEFEKGVLYRDKRMDLCKMVVGPQHITTLLTALRTNPFVKHFLLGNNLIGPRGVQALADFLRDHPDKIETWYLAGCCIDAPSFAIFVDHIVKSTVCHSIWLKRNALTADAAADAARMIIQMRSLKTLDLEQTQFGDAGAARMFELLAAHLAPEGASLSLETLYLNADGISHQGCAALAKFLASPNCTLSDLYIACNPIGDRGACALATGLAANKSLYRLVLKSVGLNTAGATAIFTALQNHPKLLALDVAHAYTTEDLGVRYNYIEDGATASLIAMLTRLRTLRSFSLGVTAMSSASLDSIKPALRASGLFYFTGSSIHRKPHTTRALVKSDGVQDALRANVQAHYGAEMRYAQFLEGPLRFLHSGEHVRYIDSVYRNRDAGKAKRGEMVLEKKWGEGDLTLHHVQVAV